MTGNRHERGAALVITLVFVTAMAAAAVAFLSGRRTDALTMRGQLQSIEAQAMLDAALQQTVTLLANRQRNQPVPPQLSWQFGDVAVLVRFERESGKVDLNAAPDSMLRALPMALGLDETTAVAFADAVQDWRDENQLRLDSGAEDRDYRNLGSAATGAADRPFANPAELRYLATVDPTVWSLVEPYVTVYSGAAQPRSRDAAGPVREAIKIARGLDADRRDRDEPNRNADPDVADDGTAASANAQGERSRTGSGFGRGDTAGRDQSLGQNRTSGTGSTVTGEGAAGNAAEGQEGGGGAAEVQSVLLDVRFPNGYEAAAKAVIALAAGEAKGPPVMILDWTPILRGRGSTS